MAESVPATSGSYGEAPRGFRLPDDVRLERVVLLVADLARSLAYYETVLGLRVVERHGTRATLAAQGDDRILVELREQAGARPAPQRGRLGLYHFALRVPDRAALGRFLRHLETTGSRVGAADHLVSEALYLHDPDNLGIEVYVDRPRDTWRRVGRELQMASDPIDAVGLVGAAGDVPWSGMPLGTVVGHVHLNVGDLATATAFFSDALGFDRTVWHYPGALFFSAAGYHHHLGTNTWAGAQARPPAPDEARLLEWTLELPDNRAVGAAAESLAQAGYPIERAAVGAGAADLVTRDPWGTPIRIRAVAGTAA